MGSVWFFQSRRVRSVLAIMAAATGAISSAHAGTADLAAIRQELELQAVSASSRNRTQLEYRAADRWLGECGAATERAGDLSAAGDPVTLCNLAKSAVADCSAFASNWELRRQAAAKSADDAALPGLARAFRELRLPGCPTTVPVLGLTPDQALAQVASRSAQIGICDGLRRDVSDAVDQQSPRARERLEKFEAACARVQFTNYASLAEYFRRRLPPAQPAAPEAPQSPASAKPAGDPLPGQAPADPTLKPQPLPGGSALPVERPASGPSVPDGGLSPAGSPGTEIDADAAPQKDAPLPRRSMNSASSSLVQRAVAEADRREAGRTSREAAEFQQVINAENARLARERSGEPVGGASGNSMGGDGSGRPAPGGGQRFEDCKQRADNNPDLERAVNNVPRNDTVLLLRASVAALDVQIREYGPCRSDERAQAAIRQLQSVRASALSNCRAISSINNCDQSPFGNQGFSSTRAAAQAPSESSREDRDREELRDALNQLTNAVGQAVSARRASKAPQVVPGACSNGRPPPPGGVCTAN